jgi:hypothetical protein
MNCSGKKYIKNLFLAAMTLFVAMNIHTGQQPGGLAAARAKAQEAQKAAKAVPATTSSMSGRVSTRKKPLSPAIVEKLQEEQKRVRTRRPKPAVKEEEKPTPKATKPLGVVKTVDIKPVKEEKPIEEEPTVEETVTEEIAVQPAVEEEKEEGDLYVQTEAHLQLEEVQHRMADFLQNALGFIPKKGELVAPVKTPNEMVTPYLNIVAKVIDREVEFKKTHYAFYHGMSNAWRVIQDFYKQLYAYYNPLQSVKDFTFVRWTDMPSINAQDYLRDTVAEHAGVNDNKLAVRTLLLPVNLALFGSVGSPGECTWNYFLSLKSHLIPLPEENIQPILDAFNLKYDLDILVKELEVLTAMLIDSSPEQTLLQIFIPQEKADDVAYLAWIIGFPAHPKSMDLIESMMEGKPKVGNVTGPAVRYVMKMYKREGTDNPLYKELLEAVENGDFGVDAFLKVYRNNPSELEHANDTQARLVITNDVLLNPESGVKFFSYFTTPREVQESYLKKLNALVKKVIEKGKSKKK